jgi:hypothetical protein
MRREPQSTIFVALYNNRTNSPNNSSKLIRPVLLKSPELHCIRLRQWATRPFRFAGRSTWSSIC